MNDKSSSNQRPEALATFAEASREPDRKPGLTATDDTAPIPTEPKLKQDAATKVLREGVYHDDQGADEAIDKLPDRIEESRDR